MRDCLGMEMQFQFVEKYTSLQIKGVISLISLLNTFLQHVSIKICCFFKFSDIDCYIWHIREY
jgi:hypothetical protein